MLFLKSGLQFFLSNDGNLGQGFGPPGDMSGAGRSGYQAMSIVHFCGLKKVSKTVGVLITW